MLDQGLHPAQGGGSLPQHIRQVIFLFLLLCLFSTGSLSYKLDFESPGSRLQTSFLLSSSMTDGLFVPLKAKNEDFRRKVSELDRDHLKEFKKVRSEIKRKIELIHKLRRKSRKESSSNGEIVQQIEQQTRELYIKYRVLEEQERQAVRRINMEERAQVLLASQSS